MKKVTAYILIMTLIFGLSAATVYGGRESQAQAELDRIRAEQQALRNELNSGKKVENGLNQEIKSLEGNIAMLNLEINELDVSINMTQEKITAALENLAQVEANIAKQQEALGERLAAMYMNGKVGYIDVILGSNSISDFMTNLDRVQMVYDADKKMLDQLEEQQKVIAAQKEYLEGLQSDLQAQKSEETQKKSKLNSDMSVVAQKKNEVAKDNDAIEEQVDSLTAAANALISEIQALQGDQAYIGGQFTWPVPGVSRTTSPFGYRTSPITGRQELHTGLDIGCRTGTTVVASNSGRVIRAGYHYSYGNMVMIDHGGGIVTLYAHNSALLVGTGANVVKGQPIARSGATGDVTGPHLHFEVRVNGRYVNPTGYIRYGV